jgi:two-component system, chemotaxis family, protein-glutamate methylesterase/glutaminase
VNPKLRVLVADDSAFMRGAIARLLAADPRFAVVGQASDGHQAVELALELGPDVVTMDYNMPGLDGAAATRAILAERPTPIVMLSAHTRQGAAETVAALAAGAVDFVTKPQGEVSTDLSAIRGELCEKLAAAAEARPRAPLPEAFRPGLPPPREPSPLGGVGLKVAVIACSTGGPAALSELMPELELGPDGTLVVVQHLPRGYTSALAAQLGERTPYPVKEAQAGDELRPNKALIAPGDRHLEVHAGGVVALTEAPALHGQRPAADVTLKSVSQVFGGRVIGVVLTGMGRDGAVGLAAVKAAGGRTLAQDRPTSTVYGMPRAAVELGVVDQVLPLGELAPAINRLLGGGRK